MKPVVAIVSPGAMGSGIARRLTENGIEVRTSLADRSASSVARARDAGMRAASAEQLGDCQFFLSGPECIVMFGTVHGPSIRRASGARWR